MVCTKNYVQGSKGFQTFRRLKIKKFSLFWSKKIWKDLFVLLLFIYLFLFFCILCISLIFYNYIIEDPLLLLLNCRWPHNPPQSFSWNSTSSSSSQRLPSPLTPFFFVELILQHCPHPFFSQYNSITPSH